MKLIERGVLPTSDIFFYNGNDKTKAFFYHMICIGHYYCNSQYFVRKNSLDSYLLVHVKKGNGYCLVEGKRYELKEGDLALLNVYTRPSYGTETEWEIEWLHFDGLAIDKLFAQVKQCVIAPPNQELLNRAFSKLITPFAEGNQPSDAIINKYITTLLTEFFDYDHETIITQERNRFQKVFNFINHNLNKNISLEELAQIACLSPYHFIRAFKAETGLTPHEYLIKTRVDAASFYLSATTLSLSQIADKCGFANDSAFCNTFKKVLNLTPISYRKKQEQKTNAQVL